MKLGQAIYDQGQQQSASPGAESADACGETTGEHAANADEDVVDAEFSEVDDEQKQ
jgi:molecular chaperone DnaK